MPAMGNNLQPIWVEDADGVAAVADACASEGGMALDTEADSLHSYFHKVCLIQVTADGGDFVIDPLAVAPEALDPLWRLVEEAEVPVLMHGADYDLRVLDRDHGVRIRGLEDTQIMAQLLGEPKTGLAALLDQELGVTLDKRYQRADWGRRPLTRSQVAYAAADTAYLGDLAQKLRTRLETLGRWHWAVDEFGRLEQVRYVAPEPDPWAFERVKGVRALRGAERDRAFALYEWRDREARRLDVPPFKVLGNKPLVELARTVPDSQATLAEVDQLGRRFVRRWGRDVLRTLRRPDAAPQRRPGRRRSELAPRVVRRLKRLIAVRDEVAAELGLDPGLVCARASATSVAEQEPVAGSSAELEDAGLTGWRLEVLGPRFLAALADD
jgi:ribonuclease D